MSQRWGLRLSLSLFAITAAGLAAAGAPQGVILKYHEGEGDRATYEFTATAHAKIAVNDGVVRKGDFGLRFKTTAEFLGLTPDGTIRVQGEVTSGTASAKVGGKTATAPVEPSTVNYDITPRGEMKYRELASGQPPALPDIFLVFAPDDAFLTGGVGVFPKTPVTVGSAWHGVIAFPALGGEAGATVEAKYDSKIVGQTPYAGRTCYRIKTDYRVFHQETMPSPDGTATATVKAKGVSSVTWLFDPAAGLVMKADEAATLTTTVTIDHMVEGQNVVKLTTALENHSRMSEYNGEKLAAK